MVYNSLFLKYTLNILGQYWIQDYGEKCEQDLSD